jgi:DNA-directed RNA polymerase specialized sigma24 family protein
MRNPDDFDAFYKAAQHRLLLQTYALTGDLPAARGAVRDAFVHAWHHWRKVSRLEDPEVWVRPHAWQHAQRRHTARIWHRDKSLDPELRATLDALPKLSLAQRRTLLLTQLAAISMEEMAREAGLTDEAAQQQLQLATAQFAVNREVPSAGVGLHLQALAQRTDEARFPRPTIIRRAGATRRRLHTVVGVGGTVAAMVVAGAVVGSADGVAPGLRAIEATGPSTGLAKDRPPRLKSENLLTRLQIAELSGDHTFGEPTTDRNLEGDGINVLCQEDRFADPEGLDALVRHFPATGKQPLLALQAVEQSASTEAARAAYSTTVAWYAGCRDERVQLLSSYRVTGVGDEATMLVLRAWSKPVTTYSIGVARTGDLVSSVVRQLADAERPSLRPLAQVLASSVVALCDQEGSGSCAAQPHSEPSEPPPAESAQGMIQVVDLPPISGVAKPWVGTDPVKPTVNPAATTCDNADFTNKALTWSATRSFLIPQASLPSRFGISQTVGRFGSEAQARTFMATIRKRMSTCEKHDLAATLNKMHDDAGKSVELSTWHLTTEISDKSSVDFYVALIRRGRVVSQVGFVPAAGATVQKGAFQALAERARDRLTNLPEK